MISMASIFSTVGPPPGALCFYDGGNGKGGGGGGVFFLPARHIYKQVDRAHREFTPEQIEFVANIVRLYRDEAIETTSGSAEHMQEILPGGSYADVPGLCK